MTRLGKSLIEDGYDQRADGGLQQSYQQHRKRGQREGPSVRFQVPE
jgi:hypothetical protein